MPLREEPRDNICVGSSTISMDEFAEHVGVLKEISTSLPFVPTKAELLLATALLAFRGAECDLCIIESDHFGEDPSIDLPPPFAAVICGTIPSADTAQITRIRSYIRKGIQEIVSAPQNSVAYRIISDTCYSVNCRLTMPSRTAMDITRLGLGGSEFTYKGRAYSLSLCGRFQVSNAVLALETAEMLSRRGFKISSDCIREGLAALKIPAKFEVVSLSPLMIVDSTHTPVAIETVCDALTDFEQTAGKRIRLCLPRGQIISDYVRALTSREYGIERVLTVGETSAALPEGVSIETCKTPKSLAASALRELDRDTILLISGDYPFVTPVRYQMLAILGF